MKLFLNFGITVVIALSIVMTSCGGGPIEHGTEYVLRCDAGSDTAITNSTVAVLQNRLNEFGIEGDYEITHDSNRIKIRVREGIVLEPAKMRNLLQGSANLSFRATYSFEEIAPIFDNAHKTYLRINHIDSANATGHGFSGLIAGSVNQQGGPMIFYCRAKDTAAVMNIIRTDSVAMLFPPDAVFHWGKGVDVENGQPTYGLFVCKVGRNYVMSGNYVEGARAQQSSTAAYEISLQFNSAGADDFARITKANIGRSLAIELDDFVYSYPTVNSEITGGNAQISGDFTETEAEDLAKILSAGCLPVRCMIISEQTF